MQREKPTRERPRGGDSCWDGCKNRGSFRSRSAEQRESTSARIFSISLVFSPYFVQPSGTLLNISIQTSPLQLLLLKQKRRQSRLKASLTSASKSTLPKQFKATTSSVTYPHSVTAKMSFQHDLMIPFQITTAVTDEILSYQTRILRSRRRVKCVDSGIARESGTLASARPIVERRRPSGQGAFLGRSFPDTRLFWRSVARSRRTLLPDY